jgi:hypothetical protein
MIFRWLVTQNKYPDSEKVIALRNRLNITYLEALLQLKGKTVRVLQYSTDGVSWEDAGEVPTVVVTND